MNRFLPRPLACIALMAFALNVMLPFFATYNVSIPSKTSALFGEKLLICTADGFRWVKWEDLQQGRHPKPHPEYKCPVCYMAAHGFKDIQHAAAIAEVLPADFADNVYQYHHLPAPVSADALPHTRAPPIFRLTLI